MMPRHYGMMFQSGHRGNNSHDNNNNIMQAIADNGIPLLQSMPPAVRPSLHRSPSCHPDSGSICGTTYDVLPVGPVSLDDMTRSGVVFTARRLEWVRSTMGHWPSKEAFREKYTLFAHYRDDDDDDYGREKPPWISMWPVWEGVEVGGRTKPASELFSLCVKLRGYLDRDRDGDDCGWWIVVTVVVCMYLCGYIYVCV